MLTYIFQFFILLSIPRYALLFPCLFTHKAPEAICHYQFALCSFVHTRSHAHARTHMRTRAPTRVHTRTFPVCSLRVQTHTHICHASMSHLLSLHHLEWLLSADCLLVFLVSSRRRQATCSTPNHRSCTRSTPLPFLSEVLGLPFPVQGPLLALIQNSATQFTPLFFSTS